MEISFEKQYQKIVNAYYKNELNPLDGCACFVGNLLNNTGGWELCRNYITGKVFKDKESIFYGQQEIQKEANGFYTSQNIVDLENKFLEICFHGRERSTDILTNRKITEDTLYNAMESTLEILKEIHISKGEVIKDYNFTKRELVNE